MWRGPSSSQWMPRSRPVVIWFRIMGIPLASWEATRAIAASTTPTSPRTTTTAANTRGTRAGIRSTRGRSMAASRIATATGPTINDNREMPSPMSQAPATTSTRHADQAAASRTG